ncbi:hypothetical protein U9M48_037337 [Paspalum notatum var. saurae]|uniref:Pectinesterase inhibitor domain-containing protein n=1 Tax=Paspalum notatum var. saurae TaxID=547442 RepID=A0AAQ3UES7_PASNO
MAVSSLIITLSLLFVAATCTAGAVGAAATTTTALDDVCGALGEFYVTPELCASALCYDPSSPCRAARDAPAVAALAARLAAANATAARDRVEAAAAAASSSAAAPGLRACLQLYGGLVPALEWAAGSVAAGRLPGAREVIQAGQYVAVGCGGMAGGAALPRENDAFGTMALVAYAVLASMSKGY